MQMTASRTVGQDCPRNMYYLEYFNSNYGKGYYKKVIKNAVAVFMNKMMVLCRRFMPGKCKNCKKYSKRCLITKIENRRY